MASVTSYSHLVDMQVGPGERGIYVKQREGRLGKTTSIYHKWVACKEMTAHPQRAVRREAKMKQLDFLEYKHC